MCLNDVHTCAYVVFVQHVCGLCTVSVSVNGFFLQECVVTICVSVLNSVSICYASAHG